MSYSNKPQLPCSADILLPHQPPMLLINSLVSRDQENAAATALLEETNICISEKNILPELFIELIAQTMAAANGYDQLSAGESPKLGYIVGMDKFNLFHQPDQLSELTIETKKIMDLGAMKLMEGKVYSGMTLVASIELKIWEES